MDYASTLNREIVAKIGTNDDDWNTHELEQPLTFGVMLLRHAYLSSIKLVDLLDGTYLFRLAFVLFRLLSSGESLLQLYHGTH